MAWPFGLFETLEMSTLLKWMGLGLLSAAGVTLASTAIASARQNDPAKGKDGKPAPAPFPWDPNVGGPWLEGIDVNYVVDWPRAKASAGLSFAICKAVQGDPVTGGRGYGHYESSWVKNRAGLVVRAELPFWGAYLYPILSQDPKNQAQALVRAIGPLTEAQDARMLPPAIDLEWEFNDGKSPKGAPFPATNQNQTIDFLYVFAEVMRAELGRKGMIYSSAGWWNSIGDPIDPIQQAFAWWIAQWSIGAAEGHPTLPKGVSKASIIQYSAKSGPRSLEKIDGTPQAKSKEVAVDRDRFPGTLEDLRAFVMASKIG